MRIAFFHPDITPAGGNWTGYRNPRIGELMSQAESEPDPVRRDQAYMEIADILRVSRPILPIVETYMVAASRNGITNVRLGPTSYILFYRLMAE